MKLEDVLILIGLLLLLIGGSWFLWKNLPVGKVEYKPYSANLSELGEGSKIYSNYSQFYPNMRFVDRKISFWIEPACGGTKRASILQALAILSNKTNLEFYEDEQKKEIRYLCTRVSSLPDQESHFIAGEGGPIDIVNASVYSVILYGEVSLYRTEKCDSPQIALHETLHALGFNHNSNPESIMYPVSECSQKMDDYLVSDIDNLYVVDSLPDLAIESVAANKTEGYLNFNLVATNAGLNNALDVWLTVSSGGSEIKKVSLGEIGIGESKSLSMSGVRMPLGIGSSELNFEIKGGGNEISTSNNKATLIVS